MRSIDEAKDMNWKKRHRSHSRHNFFARAGDKKSTAIFCRLRLWRQCGRVI